ncbi:MAG: SIS domain-containing protein [Magnetococcales bacterium]|nr:SIS domain-containing protein [Magnetococcales bacterium]
MTNSLEKIFNSTPQPADFARSYLDHLCAILRRMDPAAIAAFIDVILQARNTEHTIFFIGNGGSAATASHFANDLAVGTRSARQPFRAISLTDNVPILTAIANDYGYEETFVRQLHYLLHPGDVVVGISASGNSPNVLKAIDYANASGAHTVGLTGFDGGRLRHMVETAVHVPTNAGEYGPVEDAHMILDHLVGGFLTLACRAET